MFRRLLTIALWAALFVALVVLGVLLDFLAFRFKLHYWG